MVMLDLPSLSDLDGFAGFAALVNGLILWPVVRSLQASVAALREDVKAMKPRRKSTPRRKPARRKKK